MSRATPGVYRICLARTCRARVPAGARRCTRCGGTSFTWAWKARVRGAQGRQVDERHQGYSTAEQAAVDRAAFLAQAGKGPYVKPRRQTVAEWFNAWVQSGCNGVDKSTVGAYGRAAKHVVRHLGHLPMKDVQRADLRRLYGLLRQDGARLDGRPGRIAESTIGTIHIAVSSAFALALDEKVVDHNPAATPAGHRGRASRLVTIDRGRSRRTVWSQEEAQTFLRHAEHDRNFALYRTALATGLRESELLGLTWADIDLDLGWLRVRQQIDEEDLRDGGTPSEPKSVHGIRDIDIDPQTVEALALHREKQWADRRRAGEGYRDGALVFCKPDGRPEHHQLLRRYFSQLVKAAQVPPITFHDLRHTHATHLRERGVDLDVISRRLGHASIVQTSRLYGHITPRLRAAAATAAAEALGVIPGHGGNQGATAVREQRA